MANKYTHYIDDKIIKIYINDSVHFMIDHTKIISYQSWVEDKKLKEIIRTFLFNLVFQHKIKAWVKRYVIEFILEGEIVTLVEYDEKNKWIEILACIDKIK